METATQERTSRAFEQTTAKPNGDAAAFSIGVTQGVIGPLTDLAIVAAKENARLAAELQAVALDALHESQATVLRRLSVWPDMLTDPMHLYHRGFLETLDSAQRTLTFMGMSARLVTQAADRLQTAANDAGRRIRETVDGNSGTRESTRR
ncbi:MAG: hypothetical protein DME01_10500 [Candidatus Rokuibacteriota bacterium]|nr:MAG: hypothetical protein DME01_10500 [Candidatus Rokubacteria bacterium]